MRKTFAQRFATAVVSAAVFALPHVSYAAPPVKTHQKGSSDILSLIASNDTSTIFLFAERIKSLETNGKEIAHLAYFYFNSETGASGSGFCTIPTSSLIGNVTPTKGSLSLTNINTSPLLVGQDCIFKDGDLIISRIDMSSNGFETQTFSGSEKIVRSFPDEPRLTLAFRGNIVNLSAQGQVNIVGTDIGMVNGTLGPNGTLSGSAVVAVAAFVGRTIEVTPGAP